MNIVNDLTFDSFEDDESSYVFQIFPNVYNDNRGYFTEVIKTSDALPTWMKDSSWIKQINRSSSQSGTIRGCHAQKGKYCQGKLVEALTTRIYDIIIDARPNSKTFGLTCPFILDPVIQNKLWVPRGFLHSFAVPSGEKDAVFQYFCDNVFDRESEVGVNPMSVLPKMIALMKMNNPKDNTNYNMLYDMFDDVGKLVLSEKDCKANDYTEWMESVKKDFDDNNNLWYK